MTKKFLIEVMGEEYAHDWPGQLYFALEEVKVEANRGKFREIGKKVVAVLPVEVRNQLPSWENVPEIPAAILLNVQAYIAWVAPNSAAKLNKIIRENPKRFFWEAYDSFKLLAAEK